MKSVLRNTRERILIGEAVAILGVAERTVRAMAQRGEIPGAGKIGRSWTFNIEKLRAYVGRREAEAYQGAKRSACGSARPQAAYKPKSAAGVINPSISRFTF